MSHSSYIFKDCSKYLELRELQDGAQYQLELRMMDLEKIRVKLAACLADLQAYVSPDGSKKLVRVGDKIILLEWDRCPEVLEFEEEKEP